MELMSAFEVYADILPEKRILVHSTSMALRRNGIDSIEKLMDLFYQQPKKLISLRDIGPKRIKLIEDVIHYYENVDSAAAT